MASRPHQGSLLGEERKVDSKWNFAFCCYFTNQAGTVILSFVGFGLMLVTMMFNWYAPEEGTTSVLLVQFVIMHIYFTIMFFGYVLAFASAYVENGHLAKVSALLVFIGTLLFILYFFLSCLTRSEIMLYVCPGMRCPDRHWMQDSYWRGRLIYTEDLVFIDLIKRELKQIEAEIKETRNLKVKKADIRTFYLDEKFNISKNDTLKYEFPNGPPIWERNLKYINNSNYNISSWASNSNYPNLSSRGDAKDNMTYRRKELLELLENGDDDRELRKGKGGYVITPMADAGTVMLYMMISFTSTVLLLFLFIYSVVTFYAFGAILHNTLK